ncbi:hypothetical protein T439DRAFT_322745 [Meredithblackwellia eburnea MCA 4105]
MPGSTKLTQSKCAELLNPCTCQKQFTDVVSAYLLQKYLNGSNSQEVLLRFKYLIDYFRTMRHTAVLLDTYRSAITWMAYHVSHLNGGSIGSTPATTPEGVEAWNIVRKSPNYKGGVSTDSWGLRGPGAVRNLPWIAGNTPEDVLRERELRSLSPDSLELLGSPMIPDYSTGTLPAYYSRELGEEVGLDPLPEGEAPTAEVDPLGRGFEPSI